jgi:uncharacterized protein (DUF1778 family)
VLYVPYETRDILQAAAEADGRKLSPYMCRFAIEHARMVTQATDGRQQQSSALCGTQTLPTHQDH